MINFPRETAAQQRGIPGDSHARGQSARPVYLNRHDSGCDFNKFSTDLDTDNMRLTVFECSGGDEVWHLHVESLKGWR